MDAARISENLTALDLAERCLTEAKGDLCEFVRLFTTRTNPGGIAEEVAESTALWGVQARRWLWKNFPPYRKLVPRASNGGGKVYPLPPMVYPGFDGGKSIERSRKNIKLRRENERRGVVRCQAIVDVDTRTGQQMVRLTSNSLAYLQQKSQALVALTINGKPWHQCTSEEAAGWAEARGKEAVFIEAMCHLCPDPRLSLGEQMTTGIIDEALAAAGVG